jgi:hypothetical protein
MLNCAQRESTLEGAAVIAFNRFKQFNMIISPPWLATARPCTLFPFTVDPSRVCSPEQEQRQRRCKDLRGLIFTSNG